ncbi:MAG: MFS transporter [Myxococcota bacterium]
MTSIDSAESRSQKARLSIIVVVAALGYFVDVYDLILFGIVRAPSLRSLGYTQQADISSIGQMLFNWQMIGTLVGGVLWGVLGDRRGRVSVLYGSIILYSLANAANGLADDVTVYAVLRFVAGVGLAGELGAGVTLVAETMDKKSRGWGTTLVASVGVCGAALAYLVADVADWRVAYFVGGGLGMALLALRFSTYESAMFKRVMDGAAARTRLGRFDLLVARPRRLLKYAASIGVGLPISVSIGILMFFADDFGKALGVTGPVTAGKAILYGYLGMAAGDLMSGLASQFLASRRKAILIFLLASLAVVGLYLTLTGLSPGAFYALCALLGVTSGYWVLFVTMASEQFGTDIRATVTTTAPNFVRGLTVPLAILFRAVIGSLGAAWSGFLVAAIAFAIAFASLAYLRETFGKDLDYLEPD